MGLAVISLPIGRLPSPLYLGKLGQLDLDLDLDLNLDNLPQVGSPEMRRQYLIYLYALLSSHTTSPRLTRAL